MAKFYQREYVRCGKPTCRSCPHGPYWYAYWWESSGVKGTKGRTRKEYVGKERPPEVQPEQVEQRDPLDAIFNPRTATLGLARRILGLPPGCSYSEGRARLRELTLVHHPDRGGDLRTMQRITAAWTYLKGTLK